MGHEANAKSQRRAVRLIVKQNLDAILKSEAIMGAAKDLAPLITERLDAIAQATDKEVKEIATQANTFRGYMMRELGMQLTEELGNISATMLAWQEVLTKRIGITDMASFDKEVAEAKVEIGNRLRAEAQLKADEEEKERQVLLANSRKEKAELEAKIAAEKKARADGNPVPETPTTAPVESKFGNEQNSTEDSISVDSTDPEATKDVEDPGLG